MLQARTPAPVAVAVAAVAALGLACSRPSPDPGALSPPAAPAGAFAGAQPIAPSRGASGPANEVAATKPPSAGARTCPAGVALASAIVPAEGASRALTVRASPGCAWTIASASDLVKVATPTGAGDAVVRLEVAPNPGPEPRTAAVALAGRTVTIFQDGTARLVHPRIWLDPAVVETLRARAVPSNPVYAALRMAIDRSAADFDARFPKAWRDNGGGTYSPDVSESNAELFAFGSILARTPKEADDLAARARTLLLHAIDQAAIGPAAGVPFRDPTFACHDRGRWWGEGFAVTVDWLAPRFSEGEKARIRKVFLRWAAECTKTFYAPWNVKEDGPGLRAAANNYYLGHLRNLTLDSLAIDPADDPPVDPAKPRTAEGNSLLAYRREATDVWLRLARKLFVGGDAGGGLPVEGWLYGTSVGFLHEALEALYSAGVDGPHQAALVHDRYWDDLVAGFLHSIAPAPRTLPGLGYVGPVHTFSVYGDSQRAWATGDWITLLGSMGALDARRGEPGRLEALRWIATEALPGGAATLAARVADVSSNSTALQSIRYFMLLDPAAAAPKDPRPALPLSFVSRPIGRLLARSDWTASASTFAYLCSWTHIAHQTGSCNSIALYRKGEWLTIERAAYPVKNLSSTTDYKNTLSIENDRLSSPPLEWFEGEINARGSQYLNGMAAGDPRVTLGPGDRFAFAEADSTPLYNRVSPRGSATDVKHASRSVVWLAPDRVVVYDRATTGAAGRFKRWNLLVPAMPTIEGGIATATTAGGQRLFVQRLLPPTATLTASPSEADGTAEGDTMAFRLVVEDPARPRDVRFLHVLEGADADAKPAPAEVVRSTAGARYEGAVVGATAVLFPVDLAATAARAGVTFVVPARATAHVVSGLAPGGDYEVLRTPRGDAVEVAIRPGAGAKADAAGVVAAGLAR